MDLLVNVSVWVFHGMGGRFTTGVFTSRQQAEQWIQQHRLSGMLTNYPLNRGVYDWAVQQEFFRITKEEQTTAEFIQRFTSASQEHYHYENGELD
ncbi:hypothetical protein [Hymenobacter sp. YC55]|uniref:DUF7710 domain-containing protein n=1 Tax=Hymenobacter sp. YC55 TaxID=3034019 RepID=UPI0023F69D5A|nr:hypothetical protein [Hymenobacter sp. YC55]MDF7813831.1 hypothetical protein [Hymenobacter sp. YC55]